MSFIGIHGMIYFIAACGFLLSAFIGLRVLRRKAVPIEHRDGFKDIPMSSIASANLDPRAINSAD